MPNNFLSMSLRSLKPLMVKWFEQEYQGHEMYCYNVEVIRSSPCQIELKIKRIRFVVMYSHIHATFLDASKAFDRVRFDKLFELLIDKGVCAVVARLLAFMYCNQECRVKWSHEVSHNFRVCNGVKQGGVLSPLLFNIYIDVLLERLANSGQGCHVGKMFAGCLAYADDVVLLSPTVDALENMLKFVRSTL